MTCGRGMRWANVLPAVLATLFAFWSWPCQAAKQLTLEEQLYVHSPRILEALRNRECRTVGVLKFRLQKAGGTASDNAGSLNWLAAERLEAALVLANSHRPDEQIQLVRNASSVAAKIEGASHLNSAGIERLFSQPYPLAWGKAEVEVDAFVTGLIQVADDLRSVRVIIMAARRGMPDLETLLPPFNVEPNGLILTEIGESFQLRSAVGPVARPDPAELARQARDDPANHFPLRDKPAVVLRIYYDGRPVELTFHEDEAVIPEPREGQKVTMTLERLDDGAGPLGVVLKVNGENTLYRQRQRDFDCAKWVLRRGSPIAIPGYQISEDRVETFRVAAVEESGPLEMYYGPHVGTISLVVFQEPVAAPRPRLDDQALDLQAISKAKFPDEPPRNSEALQAALRSGGAEFQTRGIITAGAGVNRNIRLVRFQWDSEPVMSAVIRYYRPKN